MAQVYLIHYRGISIEITQNDDGTFNKPDIHQFTKISLGLTWLENGRIPYQSEDDKEENRSKQKYGATTKFSSGRKLGDHVVDAGRFAPNLLVSDDVLNDGEVHASAQSQNFHEAYEGESNTKMLRGVSHSQNQYNDSGSFSRYFDLDAWFEKKLKELPEAVQKTFPHLIVTKPSASEKNKGVANTHPTTKPLKLFMYLLSIGSETNDIILDPFVGSGTACVAAKTLNRRWIGIELEEEYVKIANKRVDAIPKSLF